MSILRVSLLAALLYIGNAAQIEFSQSFNHGSTWVSAGAIDGDPRDSKVTITRQAATADQLRQLQELAAADGFYSIRVGQHTTTSVRASCFASTDVAESIQLQLTAGSITGVSYIVTSPTCSSSAASLHDAKVQLPERVFDVEVVQPTIGPSLTFDKMLGSVGQGQRLQAPMTGGQEQRTGGVGVTNRPMGVMPGGSDGGLGQEGVAADKPEPTWWQKNWLFIAGGIMVGMNVISALGRQAGAPQGTAGGGGAARR